MYFVQKRRRSIVMSNNDFDDAWKDIRDTWNRSANSENISLEVSLLVAELKTKVSPFEKKAIKDDIDFIRSHTTQFEKNSIDRDLQLISTSLKKFIALFKK